MIGVLISLIVFCIFIGVIFWAVQQLLPLIPLGEPFATILRVLLVLLGVCVVVWVLMQLLSMAGVHVPILSGFRLGATIVSAFT